MHFLGLTLPSLAENLALDEALLLQAEAEGIEILRIWEWPQPAVVLGASCRLADDVDEAACQRDGVPILRRSSGGGTVLLGAGCLCYSLILAYDRDPALTHVRSSYAFIIDRIRDALGDVAPGIERAGISDLALAGRKFAGSAQQRKRTHLLHHGTILYAFDVSLVGRYLRMPERQPEYRRKRGHHEFLVNLSVRPDELGHRLRTAWRAESEIQEIPQEAYQLVPERFGRVAWIRRR